eukprot:TRINITY_DN46287_c0_g1_i1.p1 TRINITY_DN46287_c0_g1~~TRINITY_DN46287_c0_g1_i1.p1  ORF type:complete len:342 (-),score=63.51 TRINITY_DN46287_c0_g1_i1:157-1182(-)
MTIEPQGSSAREEGVDAQSSRDDVAHSPNPSVAPLPLPLQYPANLLYAQSMLAISMTQLQQVELQAMHLRILLRDRELHAAAAVMKAAAAAAKTSVVPSPTAIPPPIAEGASVGAIVDDAGAGAGVAAAATGVGVAADAQQQLEQAERFRAHRRRLAGVVKIGFVLLLLDLDAGWLVLYFFMSFLYLGGIFDPITQWVSRPTPRQTLDQQLGALRQRQNREAAATSAASVAAASADGAAGRATESQATQGTHSTGDTGDGMSGDPTNGDAVSSDSATPSSSDPIGTGDAAPGNREHGRVGQDAAEADAGNRPSYAARFFYQLVVMFFLTLLPWWTPNPNYL